MKSHFVTFQSPGTFFHEETTKPIDSWDADSASQMAHDIKERHSAIPFAFYFTTRARKSDELDSKIVATSGRYYLGGRVMTLADVKKEMPTERILISNMESNQWEKLIVNTNSWRITQPLTDKDTVLDWKP